jgi:DNA-3-methyladenine glycosylase I
VPRCFGDGDPLYEEYHDTEWGIPVRDERELYERLSLEAFQSGLAWITILRKRPAFRAAFAGFDPEQVARFTADDVARLLADAGIVRNRAKIEAAIANARAVLGLWERGETLTGLFWAHAPGAAAEPAESALESPAAGATELAEPFRRRPLTWADVPSQTDGSRALAKALKAAGFRFVGPTTAYASMQACGLVDDHLAGCPCAVVAPSSRRASIRTRPSHPSARRPRMTP